MTDELEKSFLELVKIVEELENRVVALEKTNQILVQSNRQLISWTDDILRENEDFKENVSFEVNEKALEEEGFWYPQIESGELAIEKIVHDGKSLARFGDGEFSTIAGRIRHRFQTEVDSLLQERLKEVLNADEDDLLVGIADNYGSLEKYNEQAKREIRRYLQRSVRKEHLGLLHRDKIYYDAYVTRPYVMYADNQTDAPQKRFQNLKRIWENRNCIFVEGEFTGLGVGNDLFDNASSIKRVLGPAENAFMRYTDILACCLNQPKGSLFLLALGPAATVLAYDLCKAGYQAVDIGHVDLEYEWFKAGKGCRIEVPKKYNNELNGGDSPEAIIDISYKEQIIADFSK